MPCSKRVIWDPAPKGCTFRLRSTGDEDKYNAVATVKVDDASQAPIRHDEIASRNGATRALGDGEFCVIKPIVTLFSDTAQPVKLEARLETADGKVVKIPIGGGKTIDAECEWQTDDDDTPIRVKISIGVQA